MALRIGTAKGAQVGDGNTQNNTYLPGPGRGGRQTSQDSSTTIHAGDNATITNTTKNTQLKFSVPVIGPLLNLALVHPVVAAATTVVLVGGAGVATHAALSDSGSPVSTSLVRGFQMKSSDGNPKGGPIGYDFSQSTPVVAAANVDAVYYEGGGLMSTSGKLAGWPGQARPTAADCRSAVTDHPQRQIGTYPGSLICYLDNKGNPGYILITGSASDSLTIDTAHLGS